MAKPDWLVEVERKKSQPQWKPRKCVDCRHFGDFVKMTRHCGKEWVELHECSIHPKCYNTKYSICCGDWEKHII